ncbi:Crp/Fnr family transcriptional regulator [Calidithermus roseus]|uniref:Global nitrogen regulator n=1 Tax=Calidithermus roseus TaxID=1644118 RepID=A0A399ET62_9DEIN|nr:Crp/Fnr family transcriptional regulator [Calidithermus roseus]RIH87857.1 Global nitrogen regulator [Calidithermus roseus]
MDYLQQPGFMERLSEYERARLGQICPPKTYRRGDHLFRAGDRCDALIIVILGQIKLARLTPWGQERIIFIAGEGDLLGTNFLDPAAHFHSDGVCLGDVMICPVSRDHIEQVARELPNVPLRLAEVLSERLSHLEDLLELSTAPVLQRLGQALLWLCARFGREIGEGWWELGLELRQEDLAAVCGTTRVTVTHSLGFLREQGLVEGTRGSYRLQREALERYLEITPWQD